MTDELDRQLLDAARRYRETDQIPRDAIWDAIARRRQRPSRGQSRSRTLGRAVAAAALVAGGALTAVAIEQLVRHKETAGETRVTPPVSADVLSHLASSDSLLSVFSVAADNRRFSEDLAAWSRELIERTRALDATTHDSTLNGLFADLDLILVQIAQYGRQSTHNQLELSLIEDAISARGLPAQLRAILRNATEPGA
jgi:hypothetical protein